MLRVLQISFDSEDRFAEVQFFFRLEVQQKLETFALVSLFTRPDDKLLKLSYGTLLSCTYQGERSLRVIPVTSIASVVGMLPHPKTTPAGHVHPTLSFFVAEKLGLDMCLLQGTDAAKYGEEV